MSQPFTRAKFRCNSTETFGPVDQRIYRFSAVYDESTPENQRYAKYTPWGELKITVTNPAVVFEPGKSYYLDFTPAED